MISQRSWSRRIVMLCFVVASGLAALGITFSGKVVITELLAIQSPSQKIAESEHLSLLGEHWRFFSETLHKYTETPNNKSAKSLISEEILSTLPALRAPAPSVPPPFAPAPPAPPPHTAGKDYALRGPGGLCTSCEADGEIYTPMNASNNVMSGTLSFVHLTDMPGKNIANDDIYSVDEYRLGNGLSSFRWCNILCEKWFAPGCLEHPTSRRNLWTQNTMARWAKWIKPGSNVIDIGANVGDSTIEMAIRAKQTVAIEAHPRAFSHVRAHALLNPQLNIKVHGFAVGTHDGTMELNVDCDGCNSGPVETAKWHSKHIKVPLKRLDTFLLHEHGEDFLKNVSFIKIDTEGFDKTLLRTYKPLLKISQPTFWIEWFRPYWQNRVPNRATADSENLFSAIAEIGYVPLHPESMKVMGPESRDGFPDLLLLPAAKAKKIGDATSPSLLGEPGISSDPASPAPAPSAPPPFAPAPPAPPPHTAGKDYALRGAGGLCTSCEADGEIYTPTNASNNVMSGTLNFVHLTDVPGKKVADDDIYSIDEYRLGNGLSSFRWCNILCKKWFAPGCLEHPTSRRNLWTQNTMARWAKWIKPGSNVIDIGANVGDSTIEMAIRAKQTVAIEANPRAFSHVRAHALLNPQLNIKVHGFAVGTHDGTMELNVDCDGCNSGPVETAKWYSKHIKVPLKRLDTFLLREHGEDFLKNVSFIKIDTEGFDKTLLRTYKPLLKISQPTFWIEWFRPYWQNQAPERATADSQDLFSAIDEIGYVPLHPENMKVMGPENRHGFPDLLLLPAAQVEGYHKNGFPGFPKSLFPEGPQKNALPGFARPFLPGA